MPVGSALDNIFPGAFIEWRLTCRRGAEIKRGISTIRVCSVTGEKAVIEWRNTLLSPEEGWSQFEDRIDQPENLLILSVPELGSPLVRRGRLNLRLEGRASVMTPLGPQPALAYREPSGCLYFHEQTGIMLLSEGRVDRGALEGWNLEARLASTNW